MSAGFAAFQDDPFWSVGAEILQFFHWIYPHNHSAGNMTNITSLPQTADMSISRGVHRSSVWLKKTHLLPFLIPVSVTITVRGSDLAGGICDSVKWWKMFVWKQFSKEHRDRWRSRLGVLRSRNMQKWRRERLEGVFLMKRVHWLFNNKPESICLKNLFSC